MPDKKQIVNSIADVAKKLGHAPTRAEFSSRSGISQFFVLRWFRSWSDAVEAAGQQPYAQNKRIEDRALLEDWGKAVRRKREVLPRHIYRREGKYNPCTLAKHFGGWTRVPEAFRDFAKGKRKWTDVLALLAAPAKKSKSTPFEKRNSKSCATTTPPSFRQGGAFPFRVRSRERADVRREISAPLRAFRAMKSLRSSAYAPLKDRPTYGNLLDFRGLLHEPVNEQGVVLLFGMVAKELGYRVETVQTGFPDCEAKRQIAPGRWQRVRIEFEFESKKFCEHGHPSTGCDVIVCWRHNWDDCPRLIEIVELSSVIKSLPNSEDQLRRVGV